MAEKQLTEAQLKNIESARKAIALMYLRATECDELNLPILTRGWHHSAKCLEQDLANQLRAMRIG